MMCKLLSIHRNGYYRYRRNLANSENALKNQELLDLTKKISEQSGHTYGSRRMRHTLNANGFQMSRTKARKLMKEADVFVRYRKKYKVTTNSDHQKPVFENILNRTFTSEVPDRAYVSDITYIWTQEGWLYLAVVIDLFSKKVVGWSMSSRMKATLVCDALKMALWQRKPKPGLLVHSDRGSQYVSQAYLNLLKAWSCKGSMSRKGNCWDNAVAESFFGRLKQERILWRSYQTRLQAQQDILQYITIFYNQFRLHSALGYQSPNQFEKNRMDLKKVA
jgi:putative transposase